MNNSEKIEKVLEDALVLSEKGLQKSSIFAMHPEYQKELESMFALISKIQDEGGKIHAPETHLRGVLSMLPDTSTSFNNFKKFSFSFNKERVSSYFHEYGWTLSRVAIPAAAVVLIIGGVALTHYESSLVIDKQNQNPTLADNTVQKITTPAPTGNIDDAIAAFKQEQSQERTITSQSDKDKALAAPDPVLQNSLSKPY